MSKSNSKKSPSIKFVAIRRFLIRYGSILYLVAVAGALAVALLLVLQLINNREEPGDTGKPLTNFDKETIELLREDASTARGSSVELPSGRINPFE